MTRTHGRPNNCSPQDYVNPHFIIREKSVTARAIFALCRVVVVGETCVSEEGLSAIVGRDKRYQVCGGAHGFHDAGELIRKHQPDVRPIEPFLEDRGRYRVDQRSGDRISAHSYSDCVAAIRTDLCGARPARRRDRSLDEKRLRRRNYCAQLKRWLSGKFNVSPRMASLALEKFAHREILPKSLDLLTDRELAVFALLCSPGAV